MLAIQRPSPSVLITPARRDSPRPAAIVRSTSGPRPNTRRLLSGMPTTSPDGVLTRATAVAPGSTAIAFLPARNDGCTAPRCPSSGEAHSRARPAGALIPQSGDSGGGPGRVSWAEPEASADCAGRRARRQAGGRARAAAVTAREAMPGRLAAAWLPGIAGDSGNRGARRLRPGAGRALGGAKGRSRWDPWAGEAHGPYRGAEGRPGWARRARPVDRRSQG